MNVLQLCDSDVASVRVEVSAADAIRLMLDRHVGAVGVIDNQGRVAGIFSERDVLRKLSLTGRNPEITPVRELMTTPVELATTSTRPGEALAIMLERTCLAIHGVDTKMPIATQTMTQRWRSDHPSNAI